MSKMTIELVLTPSSAESVARWLGWTNPCPSRVTLAQDGVVDYAVFCWANAMFGRSHPNIAAHDIRGAGAVALEGAEAGFWTVSVPTVEGVEPSPVASGFASGFASATVPRTAELRKVPGPSKSDEVVPGGVTTDPHRWGFPIDELLRDRHPDRMTSRPWSIAEHEQLHRNHHHRIDVLEGRVDGLVHPEGGELALLGKRVDAVVEADIRTNQRISGIYAQDVRTHERINAVYADLDKKLRLLRDGVFPRVTAEPPANATDPASFAPVSEDTDVESLRWRVGVRDDAIERLRAMVKQLRGELAARDVGPGEPPPAQPEQWAVVEVMGHRTYVGRVEHRDGLLYVHTPEHTAERTEGGWNAEPPHYHERELVDTWPASTVSLGKSAIFSVNYCTEEVARKAMATECGTYRTGDPVKTEPKPPAREDDHGCNYVSPIPGAVSETQGLPDNSEATHPDGLAPDGDSADDHPLIRGLEARSHDVENGVGLEKLGTQQHPDEVLLDGMLRFALRDILEPLMASGASTVIEAIRALYAAYTAGIPAYAKVSEERDIARRSAIKLGHENHAYEVEIDRLRAIVEPPGEDLVAAWLPRNLLVEDWDGAPFPHELVEAVEATSRAVTIAKEGAYLVPYYDGIRAAVIHELLHGAPESRLEVFGAPGWLEKTGAAPEPVEDHAVVFADIDDLEFVRRAIVAAAPSYDRPSRVPALLAAIDQVRARRNTGDTDDSGRQIYLFPDEFYLDPRAAHVGVDHDEAPLVARTVYAVVDGKRVAVKGEPIAAVVGKLADVVEEVLDRPLTYSQPAGELRNPLQPVDLDEALPLGPGAGSLEIGVGIPEGFTPTLNPADPDSTDEVLRSIGVDPTAIEHATDAEVQAGVDAVLRTIGVEPDELSVEVPRE